MQFIHNLITLQNPASFRVVTLLYKPKSMKTNVKLDYVGFTIPSDFVIGYGLDYAQRERNLKSIYKLKA